MLSETPSCPATSVAALDRSAIIVNEIDLIHVVDADVLSRLRKNKGVVIEQLNQFGYAAALVFDTLIPPSDNVALNRALLLAVNQEDCMRAVVGDETDLMRTGVGLFTPGTPFATDVGIAVVTGPRDMHRVRQVVRESGYSGERFVVMVPTDAAALLAFGSVMCRNLKDAGLNIDVQAMDWGTVVSRRNQPKSGNWQALAGTNPGQYCTPGTHLLLSSPSHDDPVMNTMRDAGTRRRALKRSDTPLNRSNSVFSTIRRRYRWGTIIRCPPTASASPTLSPHRGPSSGAPKRLKLRPFPGHQGLKTRALRVGHLEQHSPD